MKFLLEIEVDKTAGVFVAKEEVADRLAYELSDMEIDVNESTYTVVEAKFYQDEKKR